MTTNSHAQEVKTIHGAIQKVLGDFIVEPFFNLREGDVQARLHREIRERLPDKVELQIQAPKNEDHRFTPMPRTSRVHSDLNVRTNDRAYNRIDLIVFRAPPHRPTMDVRPAGTLDIMATVQGEDLAAVIEIRSAPSSTQSESFMDDLRRLGEITSNWPDCQGFFVLFDKSLELGGAKAKAKASSDWLNILEIDNAGPIEAHFVRDGKADFRCGRVQWA